MQHQMSLLCNIYLYNLLLLLPNNFKMCCTIIFKIFHFLNLILCHFFWHVYYVHCMICLMIFTKETKKVGTVFHKTDPKTHKTPVAFAQLDLPWIELFTDCFSSLHLFSEHKSSVWWFILKHMELGKDSNLNENPCSLWHLWREEIHDTQSCFSLEETPFGCAINPTEADTLIRLVTNCLVKLNFKNAQHVPELRAGSYMETRKPL